MLEAEAPVFYRLLEFVEIGKSELLRRIVIRLSGMLSTLVVARVRTAQSLALTLATLALMAMALPRLRRI